MNEYLVSIRPGTYRGDVVASCTCPYDWEKYCKHIGAAIITGVEDGTFSLIDYSGQKVVTPSLRKEVVPRIREPDSDIEKELLFDLSDMLHTRSSEKKLLPDILRRSNPSKKDSLFPDPPGIAAKGDTSNRTFSLVFFIEEYDAYYAGKNVNTKDPLKVTPGVRYIKKDGSPGRYETYRDSHNLMPITDSERNLLTWLIDTESKGVPFGYLLPHLVHDPYLRIVMKQYKAYTPVSIEELKEVHISFEFGGLKRGNIPVFRARFIFKSSELQEKPVSGDAIEYGESGIGLYFYSKIGGTIYYAKNETLDARYLTRFLRPHATYTLDEIRQIAKSIASAFLHITPPDGKIFIKNTPPELTLYLDASTGGIMVHPAFTYGTRTIESNLNAQLLLDTQTGDTLLVHRRSFSAEHRLLEWFLDLCSDAFDGYYGYVLQMDIPEFLFRYGETCGNAGVHLFLKGDDKPIRQTASFNIVAASGIDWLDLKIKVDDSVVSPGDIDLRRGTVAVDGAYRLLDTQTLERLRLLYEVGKQEKESIKISRFDLAAISQIESILETDDDFDLTRIRLALAKLKRGFDTQRLRRPKGVTATLRPYQKSGVKWLQFLSEFGFGGILADDMGLGKTIQAITLLAHHAEQGVEGPYLVVAPVSTIPNWIREIERFFPKMPAYPHIGKERLTDPGEMASYRGVVVTSYHTLQRDIEFLKQITWAQLILDESQALKNPAAKTHKTVRKLSFHRVLAMSGTPVENNIQELWSVMSILNPGLLGTKTDFLKRYRKRIADGDETAVETLREKLRPFLLRRTKEQVAADLPAKEEVSVDIDLSSAERRFYDSLKATLRDQVQSILASDSPFLAANAILTALTKLRQAAIAPVLVGGPVQSSKLNAVIEKLDESVSEGHKILVFSQYVRILKMLVERVEQQGWEYCYLDGSISAGKRKVIIDEFQNNAEVSIFLISLKAGGVGINLTEADYVFLVDPWWNPAVESQAIDRTHRIGQTKPVFAYRFISKDTIEYRILELQETKRELVRNVIGEDTSMFKTLSKDEIIGLFE